MSHEEVMQIAFLLRDLEPQMDQHSWVAMTLTFYLYFKHETDCPLKKEEWFSYLTRKEID
jgi:hypothetical protein